MPERCDLTDAVMTEASIRPGDNARFPQLRTLALVPLILPALFTSDQRAQPRPPASPWVDRARAVAGLVVLCVACLPTWSAAAPQAANPPSTPEASASTPAGMATATVLSFDKAPAFPVIPTIVVPDIVGVMPAQRAFEKAMGGAAKELPALPGIVVTPARCDGPAFIANAGGITRIAEDGQVYRHSVEGIFRIDPDGSGYASHGSDVVRVSQDGSVYLRGAAEADGSEAVVRVRPDGSGYYNGRLGTIRLDGQGDGYWSGPKGVIRINKDGSAYWRRPGGEGQDDEVVRVNADGSGYWSGPHGVIRNSGDGKGYWSRQASREVPMAPVPKVPPAGRFPPMKGFTLPGTPCGFLITVDDQILFDFDRADLREDAGRVLDRLSAALGEVTINSLEIQGHTDSHGSDDYNQRLSERRAAAVLAALARRGVTLTGGAKARAVGFGESRPVAPNAIDGEDNPSGRQSNRRVEIFVRS